MTRRWVQDTTAQIAAISQLAATLLLVYCSAKGSLHSWAKAGPNTKWKGHYLLANIRYLSACR